MGERHMSRRNLEKEQLRARRPSGVLAKERLESMKGELHLEENTTHFQIKA